jgi:hypothetical protein
MWGRFLLLSCAAAALFVGAACSSDRGREQRTEIHLRWFFANGGDCGANHVDEMLIRGNRTGANAEVLRVECGDGEVAFPDTEAGLTPGNWTMSGQALDTNGQTCFEDAVEQLIVDKGDSPNIRLIFHKKRTGLSAACADVGDDIDGGVPDPEPDGGGEGEGELGFDVDPIGEPTWEPRGLVMFAINTGDGSLSGLSDALNAVVSPTHSYNPDGSLTWGDPHDPPYDTELADLIDAAGLEDKTVFTVEEFSAPSFLMFGMVLVPLDGSATGSSPDSVDSADGLIMGSDVYPIEIEGDLVKDDQVFDPAYDGQLVGMDELGSGFDGYSHHPATFFGNASTGPPEADLPGLYRVDTRFLDPTGAGYNISFKFRVD